MLGGLDGSTLVLLEQRGRRVDVQLSGASVQDDQAALGEVQHPGTGIDDHGDVTRPGQDRGVRRRASLSQDHSGHQVQVEAGGLGRSQVGGHQDSLGSHPASSDAGQRPEDLVPDGAYVGGAFTKVGVRQRRPGLLDVGEAVRPSGDGPAPAGDPGLDVGQHLRVGEQRQVGVEDARLLGAGVPSGHGSHVLDLAPRLGHRCHDPSPLGRRLAHGMVVQVEGRRFEPADRPDRDARRCRQRLVTRGARRRSDADVVLDGLVEPAPRQREQVLDGLLRLRPRGPHLDLVSGQGGQRRDPAEAAGRDRPGTGRQVAQPDRRRRGPGPR